MIFFSKSLVGFNISNLYNKTKHSWYFLWPDIIFYILRLHCFKYFKSGSSKLKVSHQLFLTCQLINAISKISSVRRPLTSSIRWSFQKLQTKTNGEKNQIRHQKVIYISFVEHFLSQYWRNNKLVVSLKLSYTTAHLCSPNMHLPLTRHTTFTIPLTRISAKIFLCVEILQKHLTNIYAWSHIELLNCFLF